MLTGYPLSCTLGRSVLGIGSGVARFLMTAEYATYRYLRCVVNVILSIAETASPELFCVSFELRISNMEIAFVNNLTSNYKRVPLLFFCLRTRKTT